MIQNKCIECKEQFECFFVTTPNCSECELEGLHL